MVFVRAVLDRRLRIVTILNLLIVISVNYFRLKVKSGFNYFEKSAIIVDRDSEMGKVFQLNFGRHDTVTLGLLLQPVHQALGLAVQKVFVIALCNRYMVRVGQANPSAVGHVDDRFGRRAATTRHETYGA